MLLTSRVPANSGMADDAVMVATTNPLAAVQYKHLARKGLLSVVFSPEGIGAGGEGG